MKRVLQWLVLVPLALVGIAFAVANRQIVWVNLDPFATQASEQIELKAPLFVTLILTLAIGVLIGGIFTWFAQGRQRRALREARGEMARLRADVERMKT